MGKLSPLTCCAVLMLITAGCLNLPDDIVLPEWDVDLNVPLADKTYLLDDIIQSQNYISINPDDSIYLINSDDYTHLLGISEFIKVTPETVNPDNEVTANNNDSTEIYLEFPEGAKLDEAEFKDGIIKIVGHNSSNAETVTLSVRIPGLKKPDNTELFLVMEIPPNSSVTKIESLKDFTYKEPSGQLFLFKGQLWMIAKASASSGQGAIVTFDAYSSDLVFKNVTGYLPRKSLDVQSKTFGLDLGTQAANYRDKVINTEGILKLMGNYKSNGLTPFSVEVKDLKLVGKRNDGQLQELRFNNSSSITLRFDSQGNLGLEFNKDNSNINSFISFIPDSINLTAEYIMNPDNSADYRTASIQDSIVFSTNFQTKGILSISKITLTDTVEIDLTSSQRKQIRDGKGAQVNLEVENGIPLNGWLKATLVNEFYVPLFTITRNSNGTDSLQVNGASINSSGNVQAPSTSNALVGLTESEILMLSEAYFAVISVSVETSGFTPGNPPLVFIHANDKVKLKSYGKVTYRVKE